MSLVAFTYRNAPPKTRKRLTHYYFVLRGYKISISLRLKFYGVYSYDL